MAEIDPGTLFPTTRMIEAVKAGEVTQIHRGRQYAEEGDWFEIDDDRFEVNEVTERTLGDITDEDAREEGSKDLEAYKERMNKAHGGNFEWQEDSDVVRHRVERV